MTALSEASARSDARPQGAAAIRACQERQSGTISALNGRLSGECRLNGLALNQIVIS
jgi:hypothetical protein